MRIQFSIFESVKYLVEYSNSIQQFEVLDISTNDHIIQNTPKKEKQPSINNDPITSLVTQISISDKQNHYEKSTSPK